jgi:lipoate-protein ligase A
MAVDEALLQNAGKTGQATLRFYQWSEPTLSLGYFQNHSDRQVHEPSRSCTVVRRATGGGAILHHHELTYSFVAPIANRLSADVERLYYAFHETLIAVLAELAAARGIDIEPFRLRLCPEVNSQTGSPAPFLCFERRAPGDVLFGPYKIAGSAQRRHFGAVLQHGSVLLRRSPFAPGLLGIAEGGGLDVTPAEVASPWQSALAERLDLQLAPAELSQAETQLARQLERDKYASSAWNERR